MFTLGLDFGTNSVRALVVRCRDGRELTPRSSTTLSEATAFALCGLELRSFRRERRLHLRTPLQIHLDPPLENIADRELSALDAIKARQDPTLDGASFTAPLAALSVPSTSRRS